MAYNGGAKWPRTIFHKLQKSRNSRYALCGPLEHMVRRYSDLTKLYLCIDVSLINRTFLKTNPCERLA